jgi:rRNA maturation RNase YbeY
LKIRIYYDEINYRLRNSKVIINLIREVIRKHLNSNGNLSFIFTNDKGIRKINSEFIGHDYFTDVIAFNYNTDGDLDGEVYISIDTVKRNANNYKVSLRNEVMRVMIHGTLHLCGKDDSTKNERKEMRKMEDKWLNRLEEKK